MSTKFRTDGGFPTVLICRSTTLGWPAPTYCAEEPSVRFHVIMVPAASAVQTRRVAASTTTPVMLTWTKEGKEGGKESERTRKGQKQKK